MENLMKQNLISIIIVNYNGEKWLKKCLDSLSRQKDDNFEIILVDNNSSDGSAEFIKKNYLKVKIIQSAKNLGFAGGNNLGIKNAVGEYILILNNDAWLEDDFLKRIREFFAKNHFDVVSALEAEYNSEKIKIKNFTTKVDPFGYTISLPQKDKNRQPFNLCGFCLFFKKKLYEETGGLDENFFLYIEEIDWFWRLRLFDKKIGICEGLHVHHYGSGTVGGKMQYLTFLCRNRNIPQMLLKNYAWYNLLWVLPIYFLQNIVEILYFSISGKFRLAYSYLAGWVFIIKNLKKILAKRQWVQKSRKIGDGKIMKQYFYPGFAKLNHLLLFNKK